MNKKDRRRHRKEKKRKMAVKEKRLKIREETVKANQEHRQQKKQQDRINKMARKLFKEPEVVKVPDAAAEQPKKESKGFNRFQVPDEEQYLKEEEKVEEDKPKGFDRSVWSP